MAGAKFRGMVASAATVSSAKQYHGLSEQNSADNPLPHLEQALKPVGVAAVAVLALYSRQPPSTIIPGVVVKAGGSGLASCAFLPKVLSNGCTPLRAAVTETGSLVVYRGKEVWMVVVGCVSLDVIDIGRCFSFDVVLAVVFLVRCMTSLMCWYAHSFVC